MRIAVTGAGGFIGTHLVRRLKADGHWVRGVDLKYPEWSRSAADQFWKMDLRNVVNSQMATKHVDWVFALAALMGGIGFLYEACAEIIRDNTMINIHTIEAARQNDVKRLLFTSSACVYNQTHQTEQSLGRLSENDIYPAWPEGSYGWEKLHAEHVCKYYHGADWLDTRVARLHNVYGIEGAWYGGREKSPAALCRKVAVAKLTGNPVVEIWGDGRQRRSFMHASDCVEGLVRLMESDYDKPLNLGRSRVVTINELVDIIAGIAGVRVEKKYVPGSEGVRVRYSDNRLCKEKLGWEPSVPLEEGLVATYRWIESLVSETYES